MFLLLTVVGVGSLLFHGTLLYSMQVMGLLIQESKTELDSTYFPPLILSVSSSLLWYPPSPSFSSFPPTLS